MPEIILASQSPRRLDLLQRMGVQFEVTPSNFYEQLDESRDTETVAQELAQGKALDVAKLHPNAYVIGSDTIVAVRNRQLEKPVDINDARAMLLQLSGTKSSVSTGVAIVNLSLGVNMVEVATTELYFREDSPAVSEAREIYLASNDWKDKAGGYGIQSGAAPLIEYIKGDYDTVVGLPTNTLAKMLQKLDINATSVIETPPVQQRL